MQEPSSTDYQPFETSVDTPEFGSDNDTNTSYGQGEVLHFDKTTFAKVFTPGGCEHDFVKDITEDNDNFYGMQCHKCGLGQLIRK